MQTSTRYRVLYPSADRSDSADVPRDFIAVVGGLENSAMYGQGTFAARPVSSAGTPGIQGRFYMATDLTPHVLYYDFGTGWDAVGNLAAGSVGTTQLADGSVTTAKLAAGAGGSVGTVFPTTGLYTGYRFTIALSAGATGTRIFDCVYRPDLDGTYPWFVIGAVTWTNRVFGNNDVQIVAPRAGRYSVRAGASAAGGTLTVTGSSVSAHSDTNGSVSISSTQTYVEDGPIDYTNGTQVTAHYTSSATMVLALTALRLV